MNWIVTNVFDPLILKETNSEGFKELAEVVGFF